MENQIYDTVVKKWSYQQSKSNSVRVNDLIITKSMLTFKSELKSKSGRFESQDFHRFDLSLEDVKSVKTHCNTLTTSTTRGWFPIILAILSIIGIVALLVFTYNHILLALFILPVLFLVFGIYLLKHPKKQTECQFTLTIITRTQSETALTINRNLLSPSNKNETTLVLNMPSDIAWDIANTIGTLCIGN